MTEISAKQPDIFDELELIACMAVNELPDKYEFVDCEPEHIFTPGLYCRKLTMPAGKLVLSEIHNTEHPFVILDGVASVFSEENGWQILSAGHNGITKPGTRRVLKIADEMPCVWMTFHSTLLQTVEEIHDDIILKYINPLLGGHLEQNKFIAKEKETLHY